MLTLSLLLTADPSNLGRFERSMLSTQTLMELCFSLSPHFPSFMKDSEDDFTEFRTWPRLEIDSDGNVNSLSINYLYTVTEIDWQWLPSSIQQLSLTNENLSGTLPAHLLPASLDSLIIMGTKMEGTIDFRAFPSDVTHISIWSSRFEGSVDFGSLPKRLRTLIIRRNKFYGTVSTLKVPDSLKKIDLRENMFEGAIAMSKLFITERYFSHVRLLNGICLSNNAFTHMDWTSIPIEADGIFAEENRLCGSFHLYDLPKHICGIQISTNAFSGSLFLKDLPKRTELFEAHTNAFSGSIDLTELPNRVVTLNLSNNVLTGSICLDRTSLPKGMRFLDLSSNKFVGTISLARAPRRLIRLNLSNNAFQQDEIKCGGFTGALRHIDLRQNSIGEVKWTSSHRYWNKLLKD